jgi:hypothetical protein
MRELAQERVGVALDTQGRDAHVSGVDGRLRRIGLHQRVDRAQQGRPVPAREVHAADRALKEDVAGEQRAVVLERIGDVAGAVTRHERDLELEAREVQRLTAADGLVCVVVLEGTKARQAHVAVDVGEDVGLELRAVHGGAGGAGHGCDGADVVEVRVSEQDRLDGADAQRLERSDEAVGLIAGIDHHRPVGVGEPHDVGVLLHRPDSEHAGVDHCFCSCFRW